MDQFYELERLARRRRYARRRRLLVLGLALCVLLAAGGALLLHTLSRPSRVEQLGSIAIPEWIEQDFIRVGGPSRRGTSLDEFNDVVVHYVGNPGTTARQNRNYFDNPDSKVSSHFVIGLNGEIVQCLPLNELSAASNHRNRDTVSIEVCHPDDTGKFTEATYQSLVKLTAWLLEAGDLPSDRVIRHYDVTGKECPRYYVRNPEAWDTLLADIAAYRNNT
ncbi:MAG: N-acetylmuramoyl-L-alanine amidase [Clostridia bacterium]|nr:N-acetylmuramoyl-L-alanine amidase [Clostridia bacterium]